MALPPGMPHECKKIETKLQIWNDCVRTDSTETLQVAHRTTCFFESDCM